jgi:hypothetical protein
MPKESPNPMTIYEISSFHGTLSAILSVAIPLALWVVLHRCWKPKKKYTYAIRFSLWPVILLSSQLAGPLSRAFIGIPSVYSMNIERTAKGLTVIALVLVPVFLGIGWWRAKKLFGKKPFYPSGNFPLAK